MNSSTRIVVILLFCVILTIDFVTSKSMWGSRRKRDRDEDEKIDSATLLDDLLQSRTSTLNSIDNTGMKNIVTKPKGTSKGTSSGQGIEEMINLYLNMMDNLVDSDEFEKYVTPETIRSIMEHIPDNLGSESAELLSMLNSPEFTDPVLLKSTVKEGLKLARSYTSEIVEFFTNPEKFAELIDQLPEEIRTVIQAGKSSQ